MKNIRYSFAFLAIIVIATASAMSRTVEIKMSQCPKPYVENLRKTVAKLSNNDEFVLDFDKPGKYEFDGSIKFRCNTTIKGLGPNATKVIVREGFNSGKSKMNDDTFLAFHGSSSKKVKVEIKNVSLELAQHNGILWEKAYKLQVKVWYGDGVLVDNVVFKSRDAVLTNLDLRECDNVIVQNSEFENYNNCEAGGCLWSRGSQKNIIVRNNVFRKYGHDEVLAFWGGRSNSNEITQMKNITIEGNDFYFGNKIKSKNIFSKAVFICIYHFKEDIFKVHNKCDVDNIVFKDNSITIDDVVARDIAFFFDSLAEVGKIKLINNKITNTTKTSTTSNYLNDITLQASGNVKYPIVINDNTVENHGEILGYGNNSGYTFVSLKDVDVSMEGNVVESDYGVGFLWCHAGSMNITLLNNKASNLYKTGILGSSEGDSKVMITASGNTFSGDTRITCKNVKDLQLNYNNNTLNSTGYHFFLQEGAEQTSINFENNIVNSLTGKGKIFANYSGKQCDFSNVNISNNTFNGLKKADIVEPLNKARNIQINNNIYR